MPDTFASLAELRREGGVCAAGPGVHLVVCHAEAAEVLSDYRTFSSDTAHVPTEQPFVHELDPPQHTRVRTLLLFSGIAREAAHVARSQIDRVWSDLAARISLAGEVDLVAEFVRPGVRASFGEVIGIPGHDQDCVFGWVADMRADIASSPPGSDGTASSLSAGLFAEYVVEQAEQRRRVKDQGRDDLLTRLLSVEDSAGSMLSESEFVMLMRLVCQAGIGSTSRALGNLLFELVCAPKQYRRLRDDRSLATSAIEESLRHDPPGLLLQRRCTKDRLLGGVAIRRGDIVVVNLGSANRDEAVYDASDTFDPQRPRLAEHLAFGRGRHRCVGARLARIVIEAALLSLLDRVPEPPRLVAGFKYKPETFGAWGPRSLDVEISAFQAAAP